MIDYQSLPRPQSIIAFTRFYQETFPGFVHCVRECNKGEMAALYDMTLGYPKTLPGRGEMDLLTGTFPEEVN